VTASDVHRFDEERGGMELPVRNMAGRKVDTVDLREDIFGVEVRPDVMHQALIRQRANRRLGTVNTRTRGFVRGGGAKPWRQKGTGRARQGTIRAPQWRGGGVVFGPHPRSYAKAMPRKMRRLALRSALSAKVADGRAIILDELKMSAPKTREVQDILGRLKVDSSALILMPGGDPIVAKSVNNLPDVKALHAMYLNVADLLDYDYLVIPRAAIEMIESYLG